MLGRGDTLSGRLLLYDAMRMQFRELCVERHASTPAITELVDYEAFCGLHGQEVHHDGVYVPLSAAAAERRLAEGWRPYILDVRRPHEAEVVHWERVDLVHAHDELRAIAEALPRDRDILVCCRVGSRSAHACWTLADLGFERLFNLEGGLTAWATQVDPSMPVY